MKTLYRPQKGLIFSERGPRAYLLSLKIRHAHFVALTPFPYTVKKATYDDYRSKKCEHNLANVN